MNNEDLWSNKFMKRIMFDLPKNQERRNERKTYKKTERKTDHCPLV